MDDDWLFKTKKLSIKYCTSYLDAQYKHIHSALELGDPVSSRPQ